MALAAISSIIKFCGLSRGVLAFLDTRVDSWYGGQKEMEVITADESWIRMYGAGIEAESLLWFAVPKRRTSHSKKRLRMTHKWLKPVHHYTFCNHCGNPKLLHVLCGNCFKETLKKTAEYRKEKRV